MQQNKFNEVEMSDEEKENVPLKSTPQSKSKNDKLGLKSSSKVIKKKKPANAKKTADDIREIIFEAIETHLQNNSKLDKVSFVKIKTYAVQENVELDDLRIVAKDMIEEDLIYNCTGKFLRLINFP